MKDQGIKELKRILGGGLKDDCVYVIGSMLDADCMRSLEELLNHLIRENNKVAIIKFFEGIKEDEDSDSVRSDNANIHASYFKRIASNLHAPLVVATELADSERTDDDNDPIIKDIKIDGIEREADVIMFLYKDETHSGAENKDQGIILTVAQNRFGPIGSVRL